MPAERDSNTRRWIRRTQRLLTGHRRHQHRRRRAGWHAEERRVGDGDVALARIRRDVDVSLPGVDEGFTRRVGPGDAVALVDEFEFAFDDADDDRPGVGVPARGTLGLPRHLREDGRRRVPWQIGDDGSVSILVFQPERRGNLVRERGVPCEEVDGEARGAVDVAVSFRFAVVIYRVGGNGNAHAERGDGRGAGFQHGPAQHTVGLFMLASATQFESGHVSSCVLTAAQGIYVS